MTKRTAAAAVLALIAAAAPASAATPPLSVDALDAQLCHALRVAAASGPEFTAQRGPWLPEGQSYDSKIAPYANKGDAFACSIAPKAADHPAMFDCAVHTVDLKGLVGGLQRCFPTWKLHSQATGDRVLYMLLDPASQAAVAARPGGSNFVLVDFMPDEPGAPRR